MLKWMAVGLGVLVVAVYVALSIMAGGPKDAFQMVRFALPYMHRGNLHVGDHAPDVTLVSLDGGSFQLRDPLQGKPLVLVFGSFT
jgi:cytochrome oxidase Cu insertion factor (SCO1/SenC/PrrC family)